MKVLLDTSTFLWWVTDSDRLSDHARNVIGDGANEIWFSAVSSWEIVIKAGLGRVTLPEDPEQFLPKQCAANAFQVLSIHMRHTLRVATLPPIHRDPFDRLLIAQALTENLTILSSDTSLKGYPARVVW